MNNRSKKITLYLLPMLIAMSVTSCADGGFVVDKSLNVVVEKGDHYNLSSNFYKVEKQSDLLIKLNIDDGYYIESLNYDNSIITLNESEASILLKDIRYDLRLKPKLGKYPFVHLVKDENYSSESYDFIVKEGNEFDFSIKVNPDKELKTCSYIKSDFLSFYDNSVNLHLYNIDSDIEISFSFEDKQYSDPPIDVKNEEEIHMYSLMPKGNNETKCIFYCLNGGKIIGNEEEQYGYYKKVDVRHHPRPNTDIGIDAMARDGYHLDSWNTKKDGSGVRVGLGSRFTLDYSNIILYAQWKKETPSSSFIYDTVDDEIRIKKYVTNETNIDELIIPNYIDNCKVSHISKNAFDNVNFNSLCLPLYLKDIDKNAFNSCCIKELHFYDSAVFNQKVFQNTTIEKVFINAVEKPRYCENEFSNFANSMDRLILNKDNKKMILYGGCSLSYGLVSENLASEFPDYTICDIGIIGGTNSGFQMDCMSNYVNENDFLIHVPEPMSYYQLMDANDAEPRMFNNVESNYDLLTLVDITKIANLFDAYYDFSVARKELDPCKYEDYCDHYNEYGDIRGDLEVEIYGKMCRRDNYQIRGYSTKEYESIKYNYEYVNESSVELLESYYKLFKDRGVDVVFSYCPIDQGSLNEAEKNDRSWIKFEERINALLSYPVISLLQDYLLSSEYFFDRYYHMNYQGALLRTSKLINDIKKYWSK